MSNTRTAQELADDIHAAIAELAGGRAPRDLADAVNALANLKAVAFTEQHVQYVTRYGGNCRDCADADGVCPSSGMPCRDAEKAVHHVFKAITYGVQHGYIPSPLAALASQAEPVARVIRNEAGQVYIEWRDGRTPLDFVGASLYAAAAPAPAGWANLSNEEVLRVAPMMGNFSQDERDAFCAGFRRCAQLRTPPAPAQAEQSEDGRDAALAIIEAVRRDGDPAFAHLLARYDAAIAAKEQS